MILATWTAVRLAIDKMLKSRPTLGRNNSGFSGDHGANATFSGDHGANATDRFSRNVDVQRSILSASARRYFGPRERQGFCHSIVLRMPLQWWRPPL